MTRRLSQCTLSISVEWRHSKLTLIRYFSGFSRAGKIDANEEWHDKYYVYFDLALPPPRVDWVEDTTG